MVKRPAALPLACQVRSASSSGETKDRFPDLGVDRPSGQQYRQIFISSAIPMVGFGFMDNLVMIQAGDLIDNTIGVRLGLATLTAAAFGQVFSDVSGVCFGSVVDRMCAKLGIEGPNLTHEQRQLSAVKRVGTFGAVCGVITGCLLGMTSLLFMDLEAAERAKREKELDTIFRTVILEGNETMRADRSTLFLVDESKAECWSRAAVGLTEQIRVPIASSIVGACVKSGETLIVDDAYKDARFNQTNDQKTGFRTRNIMCIPVLKDTSEEDQKTDAGPAKVLAVVQLVNKMDNQKWTADDVRNAKMLARHVGIFLESVGGDDD